MFNGSTEKEIDRVLILAFADGDRQAAQQLTERLMPKIHAHAYYRLGNIADAEDVDKGFRVLSNPSVRPDVAFLDINLPDGLVFQLLNQLARIDFDIIFLILVCIFVWNLCKW